MYMEKYLVYSLIKPIYSCFISLNRVQNFIDFYNILH